MPIELERTYRFSAAHRYARAEWSAEENFAHFGKCATAPGHGHNYRLTLRVAGEIDVATGFVIDLGVLDAIVRERVIDLVDHQHINHAIAEFAPGGRIPTSEQLALWIRDRVGPALPAGARLTAVRLAEDDDLAAIWTAG
jgi:6-pyruvoyltetrahydropterin/6-carboxytetrahydropterin synthase